MLERDPRWMMITTGKSVGADRPQQLAHPRPDMTINSEKKRRSHEALRSKSIPTRERSVRPRHRWHPIRNPVGKRLGHCEC